MNAALAPTQMESTSRTRMLLVVFAASAVAVGVFTAFGSVRELVGAAVVLFVCVAALTVPLTALPLVLAAFVPIQLYFIIPGTNYAIYAALIFLAVAGLRVLLHKGIRACLSHGWIWIAPTGLFLLAALIAAVSAPNRYDALKGAFQWLPIVASLFIASLTIQSARTFDRTILILLAGGVLQAILGLVESVAGLDRVLNVLAAPLTRYFFQPNLLQERLSDLSFNWVLSGRVLPFGTFINGIDYAIFLAALALLALARAFSARGRLKIGLWLGCAFLMGVMLLLTLKGSGLIALFGGGIAMAIGLAPRLSRRTFHLMLAVAVGAILVAVPLMASISERVLFLVQREQDEFRDVGRLRIWASLLSSLTERPFFGYGLLNAENLAEPARTLRGGAFGLNPTSAESSYVETLVGTGLVGFASLMSLFAVTLLRAYRRIRVGSDAVSFSGVFAALAAIWLGNLTVSGFTTEQNGILMGILIGLVFTEWKTA